MPPPVQAAIAGGIPLSKQTLNTTPSPTIYASNLNEKVKLPVMKNTLKNMFSQFGEVLDVVAYSNIRMRGQAFIAFGDEESASKAIKELQHFSLYGKPMVVQYARTKSDVHAKRDGDFDDHYAERLKRKEARKSLPLPGANKQALKGPAPAGVPRPPGPTQHIPDEFLPPNNILFLQNLPETVTQEQIQDLFKAYPGFKEVRMIPTKKSIAFVEYESEMQSGAAKSGLAGYSFGPDHPMRVTFARK
ncbi:hypothetical protein BDB00DRAFT_755736 [Zychaea mexicana]|uniref:uncharacterized protein n=1 Tax=Zychaea mexicana TaxID=64656 RepID=UPI0022FEFECF|nr:uncharacterized protein BDB00DRAFT_755736 [Zychaea mexicana]KAI9497867.1 hypothetical protein BDB00DRAFT_755736 [Zychaea mexicana]